MRRTIPFLYVLIALLCLAAPFLSASRGFASALLPLVSLPFAFVTLALGCSSWSRQGRFWPEVLIASLWGPGAIAHCVNVSAPPLQLERVFVAITARAYLGTLAAVAVLLAAFVEWRSPHGFVPRCLHAGALVVLGLFLGRGSLMALGVLPAAGTIDAISRELGLNRVVLVGSALTILGSIAVQRAADREVKAVSRPTKR
jgi:hypothetical protein